MAQYQRVYPRYWPDMRGVSKDAKLVGVYLLTCRHRTTEGFYALPIAYAAEDLEMSQQATRKAIGELERRGFVSYDDDARIVFIRKALTYVGQAPKSEKQVTGAVRAIEHLTPSPLWDEFMEMARTHAPRLAKELAHKTTNGHVTLSKPLT